MQNESLSPLICVLCGKPVDIETAKTDGFGKPVHGDCYAGSLPVPQEGELLDTLVKPPHKEFCSTCGSKLIYVESTFFSSEVVGKVWTFPLPVCPRCHGEIDGAKFVHPATC
jgi:hypothetical protein